MIFCFSKYLKFSKHMIARDDFDKFVNKCSILNDYQDYYLIINNNKWIIKKVGNTIFCKRYSFISNIRTGIMPNLEIDIKNSTKDIGIFRTSKLHKFIYCSYFLLCLMFCFFVITKSLITFHKTNFAVFLLYLPILPIYIIDIIIFLGELKNIKGAFFLIVNHLLEKETL